MKKKTCPKCGKTKQTRYFPRDRSRPDGRYPYCSQCNRERSRQYYWAAPEKYRKAAAISREKDLEAQRARRRKHYRLNREKELLRSKLWKRKPWQALQGEDVKLAPSQVRLVEMVLEKRKQAAKGTKQSYRLNNTVDCMCLVSELEHLQPIPTLEFMKMFGFQSYNKDRKKWFDRFARWSAPLGVKVTEKQNSKGVFILRCSSSTQKP